MTAVVVEFPVRVKSETRPTDDVGQAEIVIFPGVRHERLITPEPSTETDSPRPSRRKKSS